MKRIAAVIAVMLVFGALVHRYQQRRSPITNEKTASVDPAPPEISKSDLDSIFRDLETSVRRNNERLESARRLLAQQQSLLDSVREIEERYDSGDLGNEEYLRIKQENQERILPLSPP